MSKLTLGSLFDGSGGFPLGGILAGIKPLWLSEIEPAAIRVTERRLPNVKHYGDISKLNGAELPPVDIITFGSPCQDMSLAGRREGLNGSRSNLFYQAIRIIKEMRCATNGRYPRYIVWENVLGAFSSSKGEDFRAVLESVCKIKNENLSIPKSQKWNTAGEIVGDGFSVAWRVLNAQLWGVAQRRRRIFLVGCLDSECAGEILFESDGLSEYSAERFGAWQQAAGGFSDCAGAANSAGFCPTQSAKARGIGFASESAPTLRAENVSAAVFENHSQDGRYSGPLDASPTIGATLGTGGNNAPLVVGLYDVRFTSENTKNVRHNVYETDTSRTVDTGGNAPDMNQGGVAIVAIQGSLVGREPPNGPQGSGINEDVSFTLNATDRHAVAYGIDRAAFNQGRNAQYNIAVDAETEPTIVAKGPNAVTVPTYSASRATFYSKIDEEVVGTITASDYKGAPVVNDFEYIVRRLMPKECARLQGFPDWWADVGVDEPTTEEIEWWRGIFNEYSVALGKNTKPKSDKQIIKWLKSPQSDSAEYKLWGNGVALPCVFFVLAGIAWCNSHNSGNRCLCNSDVDISDEKSYYVTTKSEREDIIMKINYNIKGARRKELAQAVAEFIGGDIKYLGVPTMAYSVMYYTVTRDGALEFDDKTEMEEVDKLLEHLTKCGFCPSEGERAGGGEITSESEQTPHSANFGLTFEMPSESVNIENLNNLLSAKGELIKKALGIDELPIETGAYTVKFPWFKQRLNQDEGQAYMQFISAICEMSLKSKHINPKPKEITNEKYAFRCFLLRLGFIGDRYKSDRKILLKNLKGSSAFKSPKLQS